MKPSHWLDLIDVFIRVLCIIRQVLSQFWNGGDGAESDAESGNRE